MIYSVICTDRHPNLDWQCELLEYSWSRINQSGELLRLLACEDNEELPQYRFMKVIRTRPTNLHPDSGDHYPPYNRLFSFRQWLEEHQPKGTVLILDPDCVFRKPLNIEVEPGRPIGQHWLDFGINRDFQKAINAVSNVNISELQPLTWPVLIDCEDLQKIISRWIDLTAGIRNEIERWESDMFAFTVACREFGLEFELETHTAWTPWPNDKMEDASIIHYCQKIRNEQGQELWWKQAYRPWDRVESTEADQEYCSDLLRLVNEYSDIWNFGESLDQDDTIFIAIASYCEPEIVSTINSCLEKARHPENLRFGICLQFDDSDPLTASDCLDQYSQDIRIRYVKYHYKESKGGCWARNIAQQLYSNERYTMQIDAHSQMIESWDVILIKMMCELPSDKPLITGFPPLYYFNNEKPVFQHIDDLSQVNTAFADKWNEDGSIHHPQKIIPENNRSFPRRTRFLSGAFVFTLGQWNEEVQQDPEHFYTGEEFALTIRSFTHGYDLFDPCQIVVWHRLHPEPNRKYWHDNEEVKVRQRHNRGLERLRWLYEGDPENRLGRYGPGTIRSLDEFHIYSGLDTKSYSLHPDVARGVPPDPVTISNHGSTRPIDVLPNRIVDITIYLKGMETLELMCEEDDSILQTLFKAQMSKYEDGNSVVYLNLGADGEQVVYFKKSSIAAIETDPPLSPSFFDNLNHSRHEHVDATASEERQTETFRFSDEWKHWIWHNIFARGVSRDLVFKELISKDFPWEAVRDELNYEPSIPLEFIKSISEQDRPNEDKLLVPNVRKIANSQIDFYSTENFLTDLECEELIRHIQTRQQPSKTVIEEMTAQHRTSNTCFFNQHDDQFPLANEVSLRIAKLLGINPSYAEPIQGHIYAPDQEYKAHADFFTPGTDEFDKNANDELGGQRTWSALVYLNDVEEGGATEFVTANLTVKPKRGKLVFWNNLLPSGAPNNATFHHGKPVKAGSKIVLTQWFRSIGDGEMFQRDPQEYIPPYTAHGFQKSDIPRQLFDELKSLLGSAPPDKIKLETGNQLFHANNSAPAEIIEISEEFRHRLFLELSPICEEWCGKKLIPSAIYGIRRYHSGASLAVHRDRPKTHIISAILNIAQSVIEEWPLEIEDHAYRTHQVFMQPGEMLLYEGGRLPHGRPTPLNGDYFCNVFVHFRPIDYIVPEMIP